MVKQMGALVVFSVLTIAGGHGVRSVGQWGHRPRLAVVAATPAASCRLADKSADRRPRKRPTSRRSMRRPCQGVSQRGRRGLARRGDDHQQPQGGKQDEEERIRPRTAIRDRCPSASRARPSATCSRTSRIPLVLQGRCPCPGCRGSAATSVGSGVIVDPSGIILTNNHVVAGGGEVMVRLHDGREFKAVDIKTDPKTDLAMLRIKGAGHPSGRPARRQRQGGGRRLGAGPRPALRTGRHGHGRHHQRQGPRHRHQRTAKTSSRPTPPSTPATAAARW